MAEVAVGQLRFRPRSEPPPAALLRLVGNLIGLELERAKAPERASEEAVGDFLADLLARRITDRENIVARGRARLRPVCRRDRPGRARPPATPGEGDWRARVLTLAERGARALERGSLAALVDAGWVGTHGSERELVILIPGQPRGAVLRPPSTASSRRASRAS